MNIQLDKFKYNDERWESANFNTNINPWKTFEYENYIGSENSYESDGREKGDHLRIISLI